MNTETARATVAQLEQKLADASSRAIDVQTLRQRVAYDANTGDAKARKALDAANAETTTINLETENLRSAIEEAKRRLAAAERKEEMARLAVNSEKAIEIAERIAERGPKIDAIFESARVELESFKADIDALHVLGLANPRGEQFRVLGSLALASALMGLPIRAERDHLAPRERTSFSTLSSGWSESIRRWASQFLTKEAA